MQELIQEEMNRNLSWAGDPKIRAAVKIIELFLLVMTILFENLAFNFESSRYLILLQVISCSVLCLIVFSRVYIMNDYLFALKVWTSYVMKVHLCMYVKTAFYLMIIVIPLLSERHEILISTLWLAISWLDSNIRSISLNNLRITPRN